MLLPQSEAFHTLRRRLECVAYLRPYNDNRLHIFALFISICMTFFFIFLKNQRNVKLWQDKRASVESIDFQQLTDHFITTQEKHRLYVLSSRIAVLSNQ